MTARGRDMNNKLPPQSSSSGHEGKQPLALAPDLAGKLQTLMHKRQSLYKGQVNESYQVPRNYHFESRGQNSSQDREIRGQNSREQNSGDVAQDFDEIVRS